MSISTQVINIVNPDNPLDVNQVVVPVHKNEKIYSNEPYVLELVKKYSSTFEDEDFNRICSYETDNFKNVCDGIVSSYNEKSDIVDVVLSKKHSITLDLNTKKTSSVKDDIEIGKTIDVVVTKTKGKMLADATSKSAKIERRRQELIQQIQTPTAAYGGVVKDIVFNSSKVFNGFIVDIDGVKCFMPGSESDVIPLDDYNTLVGKSLYVMPVAYAKNSIIVSHKEYLNTLKLNVIERLSCMDKSSVATGIVSSVKPFGVFILIDECVPTLLSVSEMNDVTESKFKSGGLKIGDSIDFYIDSINNDRVVVTQTIGKSEGWDKLKETVDKQQGNKYILKGIVKNTFENGIVVSAPEYNNITFFLSSKVVDINSVSVGCEIELEVTNVDTIKKTVRIFTEQ